MNFERYKNKVTELHMEMGTLKINRDRMIIGSVGCVVANQCLGQFMGSSADILIMSSGILSITLAINAAVNQYKLNIANEKYRLVQRFYYSQGKQKTYKKDNQ